MLKKIGLSVFCFFTALIGSLVYANQDETKLQIQGNQLIIQNSQGAPIEISLRGADGKLILNRQIVASQNQSSIALPTPNPVYLTASSPTFTENYAIQHGQVQKLPTNHFFTSLFNSIPQGAEQHILSIASSQLDLAPDQAQLLSQILDLLSQANHESQGQIAQKIKSILLNQPTTILNLVQGSNLSSTQIDTELNQFDLSLGAFQGSFCEKLSLFQASLTSQQKSKLSGLSH